MFKQLEKAVEYGKREGVYSLLRDGFVYYYDNSVAKHLPRREVDYNGVSVPEARLFDSILPWREVRHRPLYETGIVRAIGNHVQKTDDVTIVGAGMGITTIKCIQNVGQTSSVTVYEGSKAELKKLRRNLRYHSLEQRADIHHCIVGPTIKLRGESNGANHISPKELQRCDVLELDVEGAELEILSEIDIRPRVIIVETHGKYGSPTKEVSTLLDQMGYNVVNKEVAEQGHWKDNCIRDDVYVLTAVNRP